MTDLTTQVRDYLDTIASPVTVEEIVLHPAAPTQTGRRMRSGPLVALAAAVVVLAVGLVTVLLQSEDPQAAGSPVVDEVIADSEGASHYAVGFDVDGELCAEAGASSRSAVESHTVCGASDQLAATAYQGDTSVALAGWASTSAASLTAVYNGQVRRSLELTPIPGNDLYAFGAVETIQARFIEIQVADDNGQIVQRYFPSIGPTSDK